jgi:hypothetical protein
LILIGPFMWAGQIKSYNGKTIVNYADSLQARTR